MEPFEFFSPVRVRFGNGERRQLGSEIDRLGCRRVLLAASKGPFRQNGLYEEIRANIAARGIEVLGMGDIDSNPRLSSVREGAEICRRERADGVVALGGGSAMDCAKVIAAAVILDEQACWKMPVTADCLYARLVIADPQIMRSVPLHLTVWGAMDILSHTFEFYFNGYHRSIFQNRFSEAIIHAVMECVDILVQDPGDLRARGELWWSSLMTWGGLTWLGREGPDMACHDIAEGFVPFFDTHHGATLGVITPRWMRFLVQHGGEKVEEIFSRFAGNVLGIRDPDPAAAARQGVEAYIRWLKKIGAPASLAELVRAEVPETKLGQIAAKTFQDLGRGVGRLLPLSQDDVVSILKESCRSL
jgi:alcohol dehydrogenase YqhD (iron-dependent ADH family)